MLDLKLGIGFFFRMETQLRSQSSPASTFHGASSLNCPSPYKYAEAMPGRDSLGCIFL